MPSTTDTANWINALLAGGRYEVRAKLGEGGMGFVYAAHDRNLDTQVVIKVPRQPQHEDSTFAQRFGREIRALVKLQHPHIVKVLDVGEHEGSSFCVLQYLAGGSLEQKRRGTGGRPATVPASQLRDWLLPVAEALDFIHQQGYVHRDVKPANILFDGVGNVFLSDFGIAKALAEAGADAPQTLLTAAGMVVGTMQFMAPEMLMGQKYDGRIDQYALAVTVYHLLSGKLPFEGPTPAAIVVKQTAEPPRPLHQLQPGVPAAISAAVRRALAKDPNHRFPTCAVFAQAVLAGIDVDERSGPARGGGIPEVSAALPSAPASVPAFRVVCPSCGRSPRVPGSAHGKKVKCPWCKEVFQALKPIAPAEPAAAAARQETAVQAETVAPSKRSEPIMDVLAVDSDPVPVVPLGLARNRTSAGWPMLGPAVGLLIGSSLGVCFAAFLAYMWLIEPEGLDGDVSLFILGFIGLTAVASVAVLLGAIQMLRRRWYGFAIAACIMAIPAGAIVFSAFGVWGLITLLNPMVRNTFRD